MKKTILGLMLVAAMAVPGAAQENSGFMIDGINAVDIGAIPPNKEAPAVTPWRDASSASGFKVLRKFSAVKDFDIQLAFEVEFDPAYFTIKTVSSRALTGRPKTTVLEVKKRLPEAAAILNASFFNLADGAIIGEFVENGARPDGLIYGGNDINRLLVLRKDGTADILSGKEKLTAEELESTGYAVSGKSRWPGQVDATNRSAVCIKSSGRILLAAVYPVKTLQEMDEYLASEGCVPGKVVHLDGGGSTQMSYGFQGEEWLLGWERKSQTVPECHVNKDNNDASCYRPVASFLAVFPK